MSDRPFFFLSYAREDRNGDQSKVIERFYADLETELVVRLGRARPLGFMDSRSIENGQDWPERLRGALEQCSVFVPLLSRTLFSRGYCGREWAFFERRLEAARQATGVRPDLVQPVMLVGPHLLHPVPEVVGRKQNHGDWAPERYNAAGLRPLIREDGDYRRFLEAFADRLVAVHERHGAPPELALPSVEEVPNAFLQEDGQSLAFESTSPHLAQFYFIAGARQELTGLRAYVNCYGKHEADWSPYMPHIDEPVGLLASRVANDENLLSEWVRLDENLIAQLDRAREERTMAVLIVDVWTIQLPRYRALMKELDSRNYLNVAILIPSNPDDPEHDRLARADGYLENLFVSRMVSPDKDQFAYGIASPAELERELARKLQIAKTRIEKQMTIARRAHGDGPSRLPLLSGGG